MKYRAKDYWEKRLTEKFNLTGVGHIGFNEYYNKYLYKLKADTLRLIIKKHQIEIKDKTVLDVGTGTGFFIDFYSKVNPKSITGIDITEKSIRDLKERYPTHSFENFDISADNVQMKGKYDIVNIFDVLYHITDENKFENAINNIGKLSEEGSFIFITDIFGKEKISSAKHVCFRKLEEYKKVLKRNKIEILDLQSMYHLMNINFKHIPTNALNMGAPLIYLIDKKLNEYTNIKSNNIKLLIGRKKIK